MNIRGLAILMLGALTLPAGGADRGLRVEQPSVTASQVEQGGTSGAIHVKAAITVSSPPYTPTLEGHTIWARVQFADRGQAIQAVDTDTAQGRGIVALPRSVQVGVALASTPNVIWMLTSGPPGTHSRLQRLGTRVEPARSAALAMLPARADSFAVLEPVLSFPRSTVLLGATNSAVWLLSYQGHSYTLWRCDVRTLRVARFALASQGIPGVAITPQRVFVVRTAQRRHAVSIETRDASGRVIAESPRIQIAGQFSSSPLTPLSACGNQIVGSAYRNGAVVVLRLNAAGSPPRYSRDLSPPAKGLRVGGYVTASTFGDHCRSIWVAMMSQTYPQPISGLVVRLDASTLDITGRVGNVVASGLLWANGSLWASDIEHAAILRIG
jgi:hypothetical protein